MNIKKKIYNINELNEKITSLVNFEKLLSKHNDVKTWRSNHTQLQYYRRLKKLHNKT